MELSRFAEAKDAFATCVALDQRNAQCLNNLAIAQRKAALTDSALKEMKDTQHGGEHRPVALHAGPDSTADRAWWPRRSAPTRSACGWMASTRPATTGSSRSTRTRQKKDAATIACKNFLKYGTADEFPTEIQTCEKFLADDTF